MFVQKREIIFRNITIFYYIFDHYIKKYRKSYIRNQKINKQTCFVGILVVSGGLKAKQIKEWIQSKTLYYILC